MAEDFLFGGWRVLDWRGRLLYVLAVLPALLIWVYGRSWASALATEAAPDSLDQDPWLRVCRDAGTLRHLRPGDVPRPVRVREIR
jgi:hypothetical protein